MKRSASQLRFIRAVTFDAAGTLLHPYPSVGAVYARAFSRFGAKVEAHDADRAFRKAWAKHAEPRPSVINDVTERQRWRQVVLDTMDQCGATCNDRDQVFESLWHAFAEPENWRLEDEAGEILAMVRGKGLRPALLSNWDSRLRLLLERMGLASWFDAICISSEAGTEKPDPEFFRYAERKMNLPSEAFLHVGDSPVHDAQGALDAGWQAVLIGDPVQETPAGVRRIPALRHLAEFL